MAFRKESNIVKNVFNQITISLDSPEAILERSYG
jgi:hypothetical protein